MRPLRGPSRAALAYRDPAPSRWAYRMQRLWLTPLFRKLLRVGLPSFVLVLAVGWYLAEDGNVQAIADGAAEIRREIENRPEFQVHLLGIEGASVPVADAIRATLALNLPVSSFDLDLAAMRVTLEDIPAVASADLRMRPGGYLAVSVRERMPTLIWQTRDGAALLDGEGQFVAWLSERVLDGPLPLVGGEGADNAVAEALALFATAEPLGAQIRGLVRMGERRWDVVLHDDRRILLPASGAVAALDRIIMLDQLQEIFARDVIRIDLRNPDRLSVQLTPVALEEFRRLRSLSLRNEDQNG